MLFFYLRHGEPTYNPDELTPHGKLQAAALAKRLALFGLDEIYASSSNRAIQTAQPTCDLLGKKPTILDWANEGHAWEQMTVPTKNGGRTWCFYDKDTKRLFNTEKIHALGAKWYEAEEFANLTFREGVERVERCTDEFLSTLGYVHDRKKRSYTVTAPNDKRIALFAHGGFGMSFMSSVLDIPYPELCLRFADLSLTSLTVIAFEGDEGEEIVPQVLQYSGDGHLYKEGLPVIRNFKYRF